MISYKYKLNFDDTFLLRAILIFMIEAFLTISRIDEIQMIKMRTAYQFNNFLSLSCITSQI